MQPWISSVKIDRSLIRSMEQSSETRNPIQASRREQQ
jgi:hypothetical protein